MLGHAQIVKLLSEDLKGQALAIGLRYQLPEEGRCVTRHRWGRGFTYRRQGQTLNADSPLRSRICRLPIPPAWQEVCISVAAKAHVLATGRDDAGRKQYLYHPEFRALREASKYRRIAGFGALLPGIRPRIERAMESSEVLTRERVLSTCLHLLDITFCRVGDPSYTLHNGSYGLTTLRKRHVELEAGKSRAVFSFRGKSGQKRTLVVDDAPTRRIIEECLEVPGYELFKYFDDEGNKVVISADELNDYLRQLADAPVSAKDFRTWAGTVLAAMALEEIIGKQPDAPRDRQVVRAVERVAKELGNTPAVCRASYIAPQILESYPDKLLTKQAIRGVLGQGKRWRTHATEAEASVLVLLLRWLEAKEQCLTTASS